MQNSFTSYDHGLQMASLRVFEEGNREDNSARLSRLLRNLPVAMKEELTPRQMELIDMRYFQNMRVTDIAEKLGISKSCVSRSLSRATVKLFKVLRYSM